TEAELEAIDEQPAGLFDSLQPGGLYQRYLAVLAQLMHELARRGDVLLVGRGGSGFLRDHSHAFHVRLVASLDIRLRRVMEHRWLREKPAREMLAASDS